MAKYLKSKPQNRKKQHAEVNDYHSTSNFPPEFYDSLSKVWLTRRALRELDRRNQSKSSVCARVAARKLTGRYLTQKDLQRFARRGGPELGDLRGHPEPELTGANLVHIMSPKRSCDSSHVSRSFYSRQTKSTKSSSNFASGTSDTGSNKKKTSAYDKNFELHLADYGIYMDNQMSRPSNINEIRQKLAQPRPSLSLSHFSEDAFEEFRRNNTDVIKEGDVMRKVLPVIYGNANIPNQEDLLFTELKSITNQVTVDAKPDFYDGAPLQKIHQQVRDDLGPYIIPTGHQKAPITPNFFLEVKAPTGRADVMKRQITYDMSLGARGMHQLQSYKAGELDSDNNAYTLGATYHNGNLRMYATHITSTGPGNFCEYHISQLGGWDTTGDRDTYLRGAAALRNARDQAQEWRNDFILDANKKAQYAKSPSALDSPNYNTYELVLDKPASPTLSRKRPSESSEETVFKIPRHSTDSAKCQCPRPRSKA